MRLPAHPDNEIRISQTPGDRSIAADLAAQLRAERAAGASLRSLARRTGLTRSTLAAAISGKARGG